MYPARGPMDKASDYEVMLHYEAALSNQGIPGSSPGGVAFSALF